MFNIFYFFFKNKEFITLLDLYVQSNYFIFITNITLNQFLWYEKNKLYSFFINSSNKYILLELPEILKTILKYLELILLYETSIFTKVYIILVIVLNLSLLFYINSLTFRTKLHAFKNIIIAYIKIIIKKIFFFCFPETFFALGCHYFILSSLSWVLYLYLFVLLKFEAITDSSYLNLNLLKHYMLILVQHDYILLIYVWIPMTILSSGYAFINFVVLPNEKNYLNFSTILFWLYAYALILSINKFFIQDNLEINADTLIAPIILVSLSQILAMFLILSVTKKKIKQINIETLPYFLWVYLLISALMLCLGTLLFIFILIDYFCVNTQRFIIQYLYYTMFKKIQLEYYFILLTKYIFLGLIIIYLFSMLIYTYSLKQPELSRHLSFKTILDVLAYLLINALLILLILWNSQLQRWLSIDVQSILVLDVILILIPINFLIIKKNYKKYFYNFKNINLVDLYILAFYFIFISTVMWGTIWVLLNTSSNLNTEYIYIFSNLFFILKFCPIFLVKAILYLYLEKKYQILNFKFLHYTILGVLFMGFYLWYFSVLINKHFTLSYQIINEIPTSYNWAEFSTTGIIFILTAHFIFITNFTVCFYFNVNPAKSLTKKNTRLRLYTPVVLVFQKKEIIFYTAYTKLNSNKANKLFEVNYVQGRFRNMLFGDNYINTYVHLWRFRAYLTLENIYLEEKVIKYAFYLPAPLRMTFSDYLFKRLKRGLKAIFDKFKDRVLPVLLKAFFMKIQPKFKYWIVLSIMLIANLGRLLNDKLAFFYKKCLIKKKYFYIYFSKYFYILIIWLLLCYAHFKNNTEHYVQVSRHVSNNIKKVKKYLDSASWVKLLKCLILIIIIIIICY